MIIPKAALYVAASDIAGINTPVTLKILTEPALIDGQYGKKLECEVKVIGVKTLTDDRYKWTINDRNRNYLIDKHGEQSTKWVMEEFEVCPVKKGISIIQN